MNKNILSVAFSTLLIFNAGTAAAAEGFCSSTRPHLLKGEAIVKAASDSSAVPISAYEAALETYEAPLAQSDDTAEYGDVYAVHQIETEIQSNAEMQIEALPQRAPEAWQASEAVYNENDVYWLSRIIEAEASGECFDGKAAVGGCVMNRVKSSEFPNTVYEVIFDSKYGVQYQPTANGTIYNTPSAESVEAAKAALSSETPAGGAMYFCSTRVAAGSWAAANRPYLKTIGNHVFYL